MNNSLNIPEKFHKNQRPKKSSSSFHFISQWTLKSLHSHLAADDKVLYYIHKLISSKCFHPKKSSSELFNGVHCLSALYLVRNLLTKLIEFQTVPYHSFLFVQFWKISIMIRIVSLCCVSFLFVPFHLLDDKLCVALQRDVCMSVYFSASL